MTKEGARSGGIVHNNDEARPNAPQEEGKAATNTQHNKHSEGAMLPSWAVPFRKHAAESLSAPAGYQQTSVHGVEGREEASIREEQETLGHRTEPAQHHEKTSSPSRISEGLSGLARLYTSFSQLPLEHHHLLHYTRDSLQAALRQHQLNPAYSLTGAVHRQSSQIHEERATRNRNLDLINMPLAPWAADMPGNHAPTAADSTVAGIPAYGESFDDAQSPDSPRHEMEQSVTAPVKVSLNRPLIETLMIQSSTAANAGDIRNRVEEVLLEIINSAISTI